MGCQWPAMNQAIGQGGGGGEKIYQIIFEFPNKLSVREILIARNSHLYPAPHKRHQTAKQASKLASSQACMLQFAMQHHQSPITIILAYSSSYFYF